uniref:Uncharacterized protein n=1 Tax=Ixodes scapularis TaxID=6945 RepID=A0A4D5RH05_IXOSC
MAVTTWFTLVMPISCVKQKRWVTTWLLEFTLTRRSRTTRVLPSSPNKKDTRWCERSSGSTRWWKAHRMSRPWKQWTSTSATSASTATTSLSMLPERTPIAMSRKAAATKSVVGRLVSRRQTWWGGCF